MFNLSAVLNLTGVNTASVDSTMNQLNSRMRTTTKTAENLADAVALKGMSLVPYTVASAAILKMSEAISRATRDAIKFESEVAKIAQTLNISNKQAAQQTKFIGKLSRDFGLSAPKIAETARVLAQAGGEFENIRVLEETVAALTRSTLLASFEDLTETTDGVIAAMSQFSKEGVNAAKVIGLVNFVSKKYAVEAGDLFEAVRKAGGAFAATGGKLNELFALFTTIRDTTRESAESIAVGLRTITARLQRPATVNFFDKLGISLRKANGDFVGTTQAIQTIQKALVDKKIDPKSTIFAQIVEQLGGVLQQSRVIPLLTQTTKLTQLLAIEQVAEAEAAKDAAKQQETLAFKIAQTQQNIAALFREISESDGFKILTDSAIGLTNGLVGLVRSVKDTIPLLALLGGVSLAGSALRRTSGLGLSGGAKLAAYGTGAAAYAFAGGFNTGGKIPGSGYGDKMQIMAEPGEFMIKRTRAQEIGYPALHALNAGQIDLPGYMSGGVLGEDEKERRIAELAAKNAADKARKAEQANAEVERLRASAAARAQARQEEQNRNRPPALYQTPPSQVSGTQSTFIPSYGYGPIPAPVQAPPVVPASADPYPGLGGPNTTATNTTQVVPPYGYGRPPATPTSSPPFVPFPGLGGPNTSPPSGSGSIFPTGRDTILSGDDFAPRQFIPSGGYGKTEPPKAPAVPFPGVGGPSTSAPSGRFTGFDSPEDIARRQAKEARFAASQNPYSQTQPIQPRGPYPGVGGPNTTVANIATNVPSYGYGKPSVGSVPYPGLGGPSTGTSSAAPSMIFDPYKDRPVTTLDSTKAPTRYSSPVGPDRGTLEAQRAKERNDLFNSLGTKKPNDTIATIRAQEAAALASDNNRASRIADTQFEKGERAKQGTYYNSSRIEDDGSRKDRSRFIISEKNRGFEKEQNDYMRQRRAANSTINTIRDQQEEKAKSQGFFARLFGDKGKANAGKYIPPDPYGQNRPSSVATSTTATTAAKATPAVGGMGAGLRSIAGGVGGVGAAVIISSSISGLKEWTKELTTSKEGIQSFSGRAIDAGLSFSEIVAPMVAYSAAQKIAEKGLGGFVQSITRLVPKLAPRALLSGARGLATAGLGAVKGGAAAAVPVAAKGLGIGLGGLALFEGVAALSRLVKGKSITEEGGRDESFVRAIKTALDARASAAESKEKTNRIASARGVSFDGDTRLIGDAAQRQLEKLIVKGQDGKIAGLTEEGRRIAIQTNDDKYFESFVQSLRLTGKDATEFSLALSSVRVEVEKQVNLAREEAASQRLMIAAEADAIRSLVGFSFAVKKVSALSAFGDSASNIASGSFRVNASELGATGDNPSRIASVARQLGATEDAIKSIQSEGIRKSILQDAKVALANSNDPAAFEEFSDKLREIVDSDPTVSKDGIASQNMGPEQLLAAAESVVEAQSSLKKEMIDSAKNFDQAFNQYIDSISRANEAQLSLNQALLDFGETTRSRAKDRESFSATGTTLSDIRNRRASIGPVGDGSALRAGLVATSARLTATGMGLNRDPQNAALQQTFAGLQVQQKAQMELLKQDNQLRSQLIDSIKEELALEQGRAKSFQDVNRALSGELGIDAQIQAQETARIANQAQAALDRGDVAGAQRVVSDSSLFGQNPETIKGLLKVSGREAIDQFSQQRGAALFGGGPLQRDAQFSAFGRTEQGTVLDANLLKRNQELGQNDAANIQAMSDNVLLLKDTASLFTQSISAMGGHMTAFSNEMRNIVASLNNASVKLTMAPANVVVSLNNAEGLAVFSKEMKKMVNEAIAQKFLEQQQGM